MAKPRSKSGGKKRAGPFDKVMDTSTLPEELRAVLPEGMTQADMLRILGDLITGGALQKSPPRRSAGGALRSRAEAVLEDLSFTDDPAERIRIARKALLIWPDCAEAYMVLAEDGPVADSFDHYRKAADICRRLIGARRLKEFEGELLSLNAIEADILIESIQGTAVLNWELGLHDDAIRHLLESLRLNATDPRGTRFALGKWYYELHRFEELIALIDRYAAMGDECAHWDYLQALVAYADHGDCDASRHALQRAMGRNKHVPAYLCGEKPLPSEPPTTTTAGTRNEAVWLTSQWLSLWRGTPGAQSWLREAAKVKVGVAPRRRAPGWAAVRRMLKALPVADGPWWVHRIDVPESGKKPIPTLLVTNATFLPLAMEDVERSPGPTLQEMLVTAARHESHDDAQRPPILRVTDASLAALARKELRGAGIEVEHAACPNELTVYADAIARSAPSTADLEAIDPMTLPLREGMTWQVDGRPFPAWMNIGGNMTRPWITVVSDATNGLVLGHDLQEEEPDVHDAWTAVMKAIKRPPVGDPARPATIQVRSRKLYDGLEPLLGQNEIRVVMADQLDHVEDLLDSMVEHMGAEPVTPLVRTPGVTDEQIASFLDAAAEFYRRAPWRLLPEERIIRIASSGTDSGPWFAIVMGKLGMDVGLVLYEDLDFIRETLQGNLDPHQYGKRMSALKVGFGQANETPARDVDAIEQFDWPLASVDAYPSVMRLNPGLALRAVLPWELRLLEGALRVVPAFVESRRPRQVATAACAGGTISIELEWVD